jgi:GWxTD domain-containing protein
MLHRHLALALAALLLLPPAAGGQGRQGDWAESPEAYFLTRAERQEWQALRSDEERERFKARYWARRNPSPATPDNPFREVVLGRIRTADSRFTIGDTPGSRTARGQVFIVLGTPARASDVRAPAPDRPPPVGSPPQAAVGWVDGTETTVTWRYDRERTPHLMEALGVPTLEITIVIEPNRRIDRIQNPGLFQEYRETLARRSIVNPEAAEVAPPALPPPSALPAMAGRASPLSPAARAALAGSPDGLRGGAGTSAGGAGATFGQGTLGASAGGVETFVWFVLPARPAVESALSFHSLVRTDPEGEEIVADTEAVPPSEFFSTAHGGAVFVRRLLLPPGRYSGRFGLEGTDGLLAAGEATIQAPDIGARNAVSTLFLSAGPDTAGAAASPFGLPPRADGVFFSDESLWYFLEVANPADPAAVTIDATLRRDNAPLGASGPVPAELQPITAGRHLTGFEIPLAKLPPGDYVLYVVVRPAGTSDEGRVVRRADFQLLARP